VCLHFFMSHSHTYESAGTFFMCDCQHDALLERIAVLSCCDCAITQQTAVPWILQPDNHHHDLLHHSQVDGGAGSEASGEASTSNQAGMEGKPPNVGVCAKP
jgi:hypothetical protein